MTVAEYNESVDKYSDNLYRFILKNIKDDDKAKDVVQDTYVKFWENFPHGFSSYIFSCHKSGSGKLGPWPASQSMAASRNNVTEELERLEPGGGRGLLDSLTCRSRRRVTRLPCSKRCLWGDIRILAGSSLRGRATGRWRGMRWGARM